MKKCYIWIFCLLLTAALAIPVFAAADVTLEASQNTAYRGDEITVTVSVSAVEACKQGGIELSYDANVFELVSGTWLLQNTTLKDFTVNSKDGVFAYSDATTVSGEIFQFKLKVKEDAAFGDASVSVNVSLQGETSGKSISLKVACKHTYGDWEKADDSNHKRACSVCQDVQTEPHTWDAGSITTQPSCTAEGIKTYTCSCGGEKTEKIAQKEHAWDAGTVTTAPSCAAEGVKTFACSGCTNTRTESVAKLDHSWDSGKITTAATCHAEGVKTFTCSGCTATKTEAVAKLTHAYDNACDTTCNHGCGTTRQITHDYSTKWSSNGKEHWHECKVCKNQKDTAAHTPGPEPTEWDDQVCTVCGYVIQPALGHTHKFSAVFTKDENGHWYACAGCDEISGYANHSFDSVCDALCDTCGYEREVTHTYGDAWVGDDTGHWHECSVCNKPGEVSAHHPGPEATEDAPQICTDCSYEIAPALNHVHRFEGDWVGNSTGHWQECSCGEKSEITGHTWDEGKITREPTETVAGVKTFTCTVCAQTKRETIPSLSDNSQGESEIPMHVVFMVIGVVLVAATLFVVIGVIIGRVKARKNEE